MGYRKLGDGAGGGHAPDLAPPPGLGKPEVAVRPGGNRFRVTTMRRYYKISDGVGGGHAPYLVMVELGKPEVAIRPFGNRFRGVTSRRCRKLGS